MTESKDVVPVDPTEPGTGAADESPARKRWRELLDDLERERDELRLRIHLAQAEARDELDKLDEKLDQFRAKAKIAGREADEALDDIGEKAKELWREIEEGFERVRRSFK